MIERNEKKDSRITKKLTGTIEVLIDFSVLNHTNIN